MDNPRPEKVAVVDEVRGRLDGAAAAVLTEYRGLTVSEMAELRRSLQAAGGDYKVYKNTLVKLAVAGGRHQLLDPLLSGPTGIAFVTGEITAVAKALRDYARSNPNLVLKGGLYGEGFLSADDLVRLADLPSREVMLARIAGAIAAPLQQLAGLIQALPRNFAYGLSALIDQRGGTPPTAEEQPPPATEPTEEAPAAQATEEVAAAAAAPVAGTAEAEEAPADTDETVEAPVATAEAAADTAQATESQHDEMSQDKENTEDG